MIAYATYEERDDFMGLVKDYAGGALKDFLKFSRSWEIPWALKATGILSVNKRLKLLDAGCADSSLSRFLFDKGHNILALDLKGRAGEFSSIPLNYPVRIIEGDMRRTTLEDDSFDFVFCISAIEHVGEGEGDRYHTGPAESLTELMRVLKPGGMLAATFDVYAGSFESAIERLLIRPLIKGGLEDSLKARSQIPAVTILKDPEIMVSNVKTGKLEKFKKRPWNSWEGRSVTLGLILIKR